MSASRRTMVGRRASGARLMRLARRVALGLVGLFLLGGAAFWFIRDHSYFHVSAIRVYGAERVAQAELVQLTRIGRGMSLFRVDTARVRAQILEHPWIRDALVRRLYPNEVELIVYERRPAAVLEGEQGFLLDAEGHVLDVASPAERASLPRLAGAVPQPLRPGERIALPPVAAGLRMLAQIQTNPSFRDLAVSRVEIASPERLVLQTRMGKLVVGPDIAATGAKLNLLPALGEVIRKHAHRVEAIDLSFTDRIIVKAMRVAHSSSRQQKRGSGGGQAQ